MWERNRKEEGGVWQRKAIFVCCVNKGRKENKGRCDTSRSVTKPQYSLAPWPYVAMWGVSDCHLWPVVHIALNWAGVKVGHLSVHLHGINMEI